MISGTGWFAKYLDVDASNDPLVVFRPVIAFIELPGSSAEIYGVVAADGDHHTSSAGHLKGFVGYVTTLEKERETTWSPLKKKLEETRRT